MRATDGASRLTPYVEQLAENEYARENIRKGAESLREGVRALADRRQHPKRKWPKRLAMVGAVGAAVAGVAYARGGGEKEQG
jgi:hypothetical protein